MSDGTQYDKAFVWDQDAMINRLHDTLEQIDAAGTDAEKTALREVARTQNEELYKLHGVDLGPF